MPSSINTYIKKGFFAVLATIVVYMLLGASVASAASVSINSSVGNNTILDYGTSFTIFGTIDPASDNETVSVQSRAAGSSAFTGHNVKTNGGGKYFFTFKGVKSGYYKATWNGEFSDTVFIGVRSKITLGRLNRPKWTGQDFYVRGTLFPTLKGKLVALQINKGGWRTIAKGRTDNKSIFNIHARLLKKGGYRLRVVYEDVNHFLGSSNGFNIRITWGNPWKISAKYSHYIVVSKKSFYLWYLRNGRIVKKFRAGVGQPRYPTPSGNFRIVRKAVRPTWYAPNSSWAKNMPASIPWPASPLGERGLYLSISGIIIHGTTQPRLLDRPYRAVSHGCIRQKNAWVIWLYNRVPVGTPVKIYG